MSKISVITITFNNHDELMNTVNSIKGIDFVEHIVINGGSDHRTINFLKNDFFGKFISEKDSGIADAINKGIKLVSSPYFLILNSGDVLIEKIYLEKCIELLDNNQNIDFIHADIVFDDFFAKKILIKPTFCQIGRGMPFNILTAVFRTKSFLKVGLFNIDYKIAMDYDWVIRSLKFNLNNIYFPDFPVVLMDGSGISSKSEFKGIKECYFSLISNNAFNILTKWNFFKRLSLFLIRDFLTKLKMGKVIIFIKKLKYKTI